MISTSQNNLINISMPNKHMDEILARKMDNLRKRIRKLDSAVVAFSGGVDSTLLMRICREELGERAVAVTVLSENYPSSELSLARRIAKVVGAKHLTIQTSAPNVPARALCSGKFFRSLKNVAARMRFKNVLSGSHKDDAAERSFSLLAAKHAGVKSPLLESGMSKAEVRVLAKELGLPNWDKPPSSSRKKDSKSLLRVRKIEAAKRYLHSLGIKRASILANGRRIFITGTKSDITRLSKNMERVKKKMKLLGLPVIFFRVS